MLEPLYTAAEMRAAEDRYSGTVEELMDRVLQLDGIPNLQRQHPFSVGERAVEQLQLAQTLESGALDQYRAGITTCQTRI